MHKLSELLQRILQAVFKLTVLGAAVERLIKFDVGINRRTFVNLGRSKFEFSSAHEKLAILSILSVVYVCFSICLLCVECFTAKGGHKTEVQCPQLHCNLPSFLTNHTKT